MIAASIKENLYKDSVALMRIAEDVQALAGVRQATLLMGTPANKAVLAQAGLLDASLETARPGDLMIVVEADGAEAIDAAHAEFVRLLEGARSGLAPGAAAEFTPRSIAMACARDPAIGLAQISVPGPYAAAEAMKALKQDLDVFLFSDNVPLAHERAIKELARAKGRLVMGPDCGTAILHGTPVGFANAVRRGAIGLIGASGTGLQEVTCQIDVLGRGVSHAIGTGGRDVSAEIGGSTMRQAIDLLAADAATRVIVIVSKPPARAVARQVLQQLAATGKPCAVLFLGADLSAERIPERVVVVDTLYDAAAASVALLDARRFEYAAAVDGASQAADAEAQRLAPGQCFLRGLYSGGTFCTEAQLVWRGLGLHVHSNVPVDRPAATSANIARNAASAAGAAMHAAFDLGSDEFTVGRPHPMIDPGTRIERIAAESRDATTAALVLDVVLGYGSHPDPAGALAPAIVEAKAAAASEGRHLAVVAFVCGTEADPQRLSAQQAALRGAGALIAPGSTAAARMAGVIAVRAAERNPQRLAAHC